MYGMPSNWNRMFRSAALTATAVCGAAGAGAALFWVALALAGRSCAMSEKETPITASASLHTFCILVYRVSPLLSYSLFRAFQPSKRLERRGFQKKIFASHRPQPRQTKVPKQAQIPAGRMTRFFTSSKLLGSLQGQYL